MGLRRLDSPLEIERFLGIFLIKEFLLWTH